MKGLSLKTDPAFLVCLLTYRPQVLRMYGFPDSFSLSQFFYTSFGFYNLKVSWLTNFYIKQVKFLRCKCTSLFPYKKQVQRSWLHFSKILKKSPTSQV